MKQHFKDAAKAYGISGKYLETCIKLASNIQREVQNTDVADEVDDLLICLIAHLRTIQEEQCMLAVGGSYRPRTQQIFRSIHNNPGQFTPTVIEELCTSATLAAILAEPQVNRDRERSGFGSNWFRGNNFQFRGSGRGFFNQQGFGQVQENNTSFRPRQMPIERANKD